MNALLAVILAIFMLTPERVEWFREDWTRFPPHVLGINQWEGQQRLIRALQQHRWVACKSGHKVGKTHVVGSICNTILPLYPHSRIITTASTGDQLSENVWGEIRSQHRAANMPLGGKMLPSRNEWRIGDMWYCRGISTDEPESFQGKHAERGLVVVIMDECQAIDREIWKAARTMTADANGYLLVIANPTIPSGPFFDACTTDPLFHVETLSCYDHPNIVEGRKVMPGPTMDLIRTFEGTPDEGPRLRGEFNEDGSDRLISIAALKGCYRVASTETDNTHIGVDIADQGDDENVACITKNRRVVDVRSWRHTGPESLMRTCGTIQQIASEHGCPAENVHIDGIGVGAGVGSRLWELGFCVDIVIFGAGPEGDWDMVIGTEYEFANRRAELHWVAKHVIEHQMTEIPQEFSTLHADLAAPGWGYVSERKVKIEAKKDIKKRLGRSPDHGDAYVYSLARSGNRVPRMRNVTWSDDAPPEASAPAGKADVPWA